LDVRHKRNRQLIGKGHIEIAGREGEDRRRAVWDDRVLDAIKIGQTGLPVVRIAAHLNALVALEFDELEGPGSDWRAAHILRGDVARIDRSKSGCQEGQDTWLRVLQVEHRLVVAIDRHALDVGVPALAEVDFESLLGPVRQQVPGTLYVRG